jgi:LPXTG-motif cell wall-anchored protein
MGEIDNTHDAGASALWRPRKKNSTMSKIPSIAFLVIGIVLLVYGIDASNSVSSSLSNAVTGSPTDKSIWLIVLGVLGILSGGFGLFFRRSP